MNKNKIMSVMLVGILLTASCGVLLNIEDEPVEESEALFPIPLVIALCIVSGLAGGMIGYAIADAQDGGDQEEVNAVLRQLESEKVTMTGETVRAFAGTILPADIDAWALTMQHFTKAAELAVCDSWSLAGTYDPNFTLESSLQRVNINAYLYDWQGAFDNAYTHVLIKHINTWASKEYLQDVSATLNWGLDNATLKNAIMDWCQIVENVDYGSTVYIDASTEVKGGTYHHDTSGTLYKLSSGNVQLRDMSSGKVVTITGDTTNLSTVTYDGGSEKIKPGIYRIETAGSTLAGPLSMSASDDGAKVTGALVHRVGSSMTWFTSEEGKNYVNTQTAKTEITTLSMDITYVDRYEKTTTDKTFILTEAFYDSVKKKQYDEAKLLADWSALIDRMNYTIERAAIAGQVLWDIFDICETSIPFLAPSSMITAIDGVSLNAVQAKGIAWQYMQSIATMYPMYKDKLDAQLPQTFSPESLSLYVCGDIYLNGKLQHENVIFTPYSALEKQIFEVGKETQWVNAGSAMIWGFGPIDGWTGPESTSAYKGIPLGTGYSIKVREIGANGVLKESASISPVEIEKYTVDPTDPPGPPDPPIIGTMSLLTIIMLLAGVAMAIYGVLRGQFTLVIIGGIVVVASFFIPGWLW